MRPSYIYALHVLGEGPRYIGQTSHPSQRLKQHRAEKRKTHKCRWINKVGPSNVFMTILEKTPPKFADLVERRIIQEGKRTGWRLTNATDGGEGLRNPSVETRRKIRDGNRGKVVSAETRRKMSESRKGGKRSMETRRKMSDAHKGKKPSLAACQNMSEAQKGRKHSAETRQKMVEAWKERKKK